MSILTVQEIADAINRGIKDRVDREMQVIESNIRAILHPEPTYENPLAQLSSEQQAVVNTLVEQRREALTARYKTATLTGFYTSITGMQVNG